MIGCCFFIFMASMTMINADSDLDKNRAVLYIICLLIYMLIDEVSKKIK